MKRGVTAAERDGFTDRPWKGDDALIVKDRTSAVDARYVNHRRGTSWAWHFSDRLTAEELYDWLLSLR
jgi:hypothetical protein